MVSYGGTKDPSDTTVAGFPASVQEVQIEFPIITSGLAYLLTYVLPSELKNDLDIIRGIYGEFVPLPPYFGQSLPRMPVMNFYSYYMEPGALPMQYVKVPSDEHIPKFFLKTKFGQDSDLAALYKATADRVFSKTDGGTSPAVTESMDELPVVEGESVDENLNV